MVHNALCINYAFTSRRYATFVVGIARRDGDPPYHLLLPNQGEPGRDPEFLLLSRRIRAVARGSRARACDGTIVFGRRGICSFFTCPISFSAHSSGQSQGRQRCRQGNISMIYPSRIFRA